MTELIKYLSPVALLGIIWAVVQFYQKRADEKRNKLRNEKLTAYDQIYTTLRSIEFEINKFMSNSRITLVEIKDEVDSVNELLQDFTNQNDLINEGIIKLQNKDKVNEQELKALDTQWIKNKEHLNSIVLRQEKAIDKNLELIYPLFESLISTLETHIKEINTVSIIALPNSAKLEEKIYKLTSEINSTAELYHTKKFIDKNGIPNSGFAEKIINIFDITYLIKSHIDKDLK